VGGRNSTLRQSRLLIALLLAAAALLVLVAFRERATADFLADLGRTPGFETDTGSATYYQASWFDLAVGVVLAGLAFMVLTRGGRIWSRPAGIVSAFAAGMGAWTLWSDHPEVATPLPMTALGVALAVSARLATLTSIIGWLGSPPDPSTRPMIPSVPPSHQAG